MNDVVGDIAIQALKLVLKSKYIDDAVYIKDRDYLDNFLEDKSYEEKVSILENVITKKSFPIYNLEKIPDIKLENPTLSSILHNASLEPKERSLALKKTLTLML